MVDAVIVGLPSIGLSIGTVKITFVPPELIYPEVSISIDIVSPFL